MSFKVYSPFIFFSCEKKIDVAPLSSWESVKSNLSSYENPILLP